MGVVKNLSGQRFGKLVALEFVGISKHHKALWLCQCDCGRKTTVISIALINGNTKTCGRCSDIDVSGKVFGRLTAIEVYSRDKSAVNWRCLCSCGNERIVSLSNLVHGVTKSCGCLRREVSSALLRTHGLTGTKEYEVAKTNRRRELKKKLDVSWDTEKILALKKFFKKCVICGGTDRMSADHVYPLSKGRGLEPGNAVLLCVHCNATKWCKAPDELPEDVRNKILKAANDFKVYWDSLPKRD